MKRRRTKRKRKNDSMLRNSARPSQRGQRHILVTVVRLTEGIVYSNATIVLQSDSQ
jgi:hypothetical protein